MNRRKFERYLQSHACHFHKDGGDHELWLQTGNKKPAAIPRHVEITQGVVRSVCRQFNIPLPPWK
jgi:hypothetical protein